MGGPPRPELQSPSVKFQVLQSARLPRRSVGILSCKTEINRYTFNTQYVFERTDTNVSTYNILTNYSLTCNDQSYSARGHNG